MRWVLGDELVFTKKRESLLSRRMVGAKGLSKSKISTSSVSWMWNTWLTWRRGIFLLDKVQRKRYVWEEVWPRTEGISQVLSRQGQEFGFLEKVWLLIGESSPFSCCPAPLRPATKSGWLPTTRERRALFFNRSSQQFTEMLGEGCWNFTATYIF